MTLLRDLHPAAKKKIAVSVNVFVHMYQWLCAIVDQCAFDSMPYLYACMCVCTYAVDLDIKERKASVRLICCKAIQCC